jgi:acyl-ACP thioesterase
VLGPELVPLPTAGRVFSAARRVRLGDVAASGRLRIDAAARYLQDVARDDSADSGLQRPMAWVVRRTYLDVVQAPVFQEHVELATWCSGFGSRWAERRTVIEGDLGGRVDTVALWVHVDPDTGRPARLGPDFAALYGEAAAGRVVDARLTHEPRPPEDARPRPWPWRAADFDILGHVNNAAYGAAIEEVVRDEDDLGSAFRAELEYRDPARPGSVGEIVGVRRDGVTEAWVLADGRVACSARVARR